MLTKILFGFLAFMAVLAIFGKFRFPGQSKLEAAKCKRCGRFKIGKRPCSCGKG